MGQDLRALFKKERERKYNLKSGHETRFLKRLDRELPKTARNPFWIFKIAVSVLVLVSAGIIGYRAYYKHNDNMPIPVVDRDDNKKRGEFSFGDLSPDLKKVENYYVANINIALSKLEVSSENKDLVDSFMERLSELNQEYRNLNTELIELGPNDQTISALIQNLQLRLQLLQKLKKKLDELKLSKNEQITANSI
ncbi:hypothetical protein [Maribacter sp. 2304DJ31-5]|uniref:hypothetical protein n=1 Tax=Maribacter sp. 2304DJ31-5 TaxID=3386273 RepID=UPI0039BC3868